MTKAITVNVPNIGPILMEKSKRAKRLIISVKPFRGVRVAVPWRLTFKTANKFLQGQLAWVEQSVERMRKVEAEHLTTIENAPKINKPQGRIILVERLAELAKGCGFSYNRIFVRNQKTRWGSCSSKNNINLNVNLLRLKPELMDYVMLHELVHTEIKNHSKAFWARLNHFVGDAKKLDRELGKHRLGLL